MTLFKGPLSPLDELPHEPASATLFPVEAYAPEFGNRLASARWLGRPLTANAYGKGRVRPRRLPVSPSRPSHRAPAAAGSRECTRH